MTSKVGKELIVRGRQRGVTRTEAGFFTSPLHDIETDVAVDFADARAADVAEIALPAADDAIVELALADGSFVLTTADQVRAWAARTTERGGDRRPVVTGRLPWARDQRGLVDLALKSLRLLKIAPLSGVAKSLGGEAAAKAIAIIESTCLKNAGVDPGLYRLTPDAQIGARIDQPSAIVSSSDKPALVFIHGTASYAQGAFKGLLEPDRPAWKALTKRYGDRIYAFQHRTLSESPAENALALANALPERAALHLVTHSRGGIVGELLCRGAIDDSSLALFGAKGGAKGRPANERETLAELGRALAAKRFAVERFVRVGCPAAGTTLASDRLDLYLSLLVNALKFVPTGPFAPAVDLASAVLVEAVRRRASPEDIPGLEAQRPESPYTHFLNRGDNDAVDHDLSIIAGDVHGGTFLQTLRAMASYAFYMERNDLVVNTKSMSGGLPRKGLVIRSTSETPQLTHCNYFTEDVTRDKVLAALLRERRDAVPPGFESFSGERAVASRGHAAAPQPARKKRAKIAGAPSSVVLVVPDLFASALSDGSRMIFPDAAAIAERRFRSAPPRPLKADLHRADERLDALASEMRDADVRAVPYDWRLGVEEAVTRLSKAFTDAAATTERVHLVGHGLGAMAVLSFIAAGGAAWKRCAAAGGRCVLLAPPLEGADAALRLLAGRGPWFQSLSMMDPSDGPDGWKEWFASLPGVVDLLPDEALEPAVWKGSAAAKPSSELLAAAKSRRAAARRGLREAPALAVFGHVARTWRASMATETGPRSGIEESESSEGDGWLAAAPSLPDGVERVDVAATHEELLGAATAAAAIARWLSRGTIIESRGGDAASDAGDERLASFPTQEDIDHRILHGRWELPPAPQSRLDIRVVHGSVDRIAAPVAIGHYEGDSIFGAEGFLDRCLDRRLRRRLQVGYGRYPGRAGSALYLASPGTLPKGALVVGLGPVGELTAGVLTRGITAATLDMAMDEIDRRRGSGDRSDEPIRLELASLLIGTRGGQQLSVRQAIVAIANGVLEANRVLASTRTDDAPNVRIAQLSFVELWSDIAVEAAHIVRVLDREAGLVVHSNETVVGAERITTAEGARGNSRVSADWSWWRRLIVAEEAEKSGTARGLHFTALGERARAEDRTVATAGATVDRMIEESIGGEEQVASLAISKALYELLLPNAIKDRLYDGDDLVLVVDPGAARYPWELLARASGGAPEALVRRVKVVRQLRTSTPRDAVVSATGRRALVIANPKGVSPSLAGAEEEGGAIAECLRKASFTAEASIAEGASRILQRFFRHDYVIMHVAAHGDFNERKPEESGVIIGEDSVLTAAMFRQLRATPELVFLNCCHLGKLGTPRGARTPGQYAASVASALIDIGVRCVIVAGWEVDDAAAKLFAETFYGQFLRGVPFGDSVHAARAAVIDRFTDSNTWGAYQCYGDPAFRLTSATSSDSEEAADRPFVSAAEALDYVDDVTAGAASAGNDEPERERLRARLREIEAKLSVVPEWEQDGRLLAARADAWAAVGDGDGEGPISLRAIDLYRRSLRADHAWPTVRAIEQLGNLLDREESKWRGKDAARYERRKQRICDGATAPVEKLAAQRGESLAERWMSAAEALGETPERHQIRAAQWKRLAETHGDWDERAKGFRRAADEYKRAADLRRANGITFQRYYPLAQYITLRWLSSNARERGEFAASDELKELLADCRESIRTEIAESGRTFWAMASEIELDLIEGFGRGLSKEAEHSIAERYRNLLNDHGTVREHDSVLANLDFLSRNLDLLAKSTSARSSAGMKAPKRATEAPDATIAELKPEALKAGIDGIAAQLRQPS
ncbi:MAG: CHAT domain-containing protein [Phycisphaerales bacterium]